VTSDAPGTAGGLSPADDPSWGSYGETILRVHGAIPFEIDLAVPVGALQREALAAAGLAGPFGLVTPCNPRGHVADAATNTARLTAFHQALREVGAQWVRVDGLSADRAHVEEGVALRWPVEAVEALARAWEQSAIYWWDGEAFWVRGALTQAPPWRLPEGGG
jgi:hypothetical protein